MISNYTNKSFRHYLLSFKTAIAATLLVNVFNPALAGTLCGETACDADIQFANGGSIVAVSGAAISFNEGGLISLGEGGNVQLGSGGSLVNIESLAAGEVAIDAGAQIVLGSGGLIEFGQGGYITFAGNIAYDDGVIVEINEASELIITSDMTAGAVSLSAIDTSGTVAFSSETFTSLGVASGTGVIVNGSDTSDVVDIAANQITIDTLVAAGVLTIESNTAIFNGETGTNESVPIDSCGSSLSGDTTISTGDGAGLSATGECINADDTVVGDTSGTLPDGALPDTGAIETPPDPVIVIADPTTGPDTIEIDGSAEVIETPVSNNSATQESTATETAGGNGEGDRTPANPFGESQAEATPESGGGGSWSLTFAAIMFALGVVRRFRRIDMM
ncbi:MAG: hypothetical protein PVH98_02775 [Gammaproteobacteria bacterium]|jgi:hypothetical protein